MSFFKRLLGRDFGGSVAKGDKYSEENRLGEAVIAYAEALEQSSGVPKKEVDAIRAKRDAIRDKLARAHLLEGVRYVKEGDYERALEMLELAADAAASEELREEARKEIDNLDAAEARDVYDEEARELSDAERYLALSGAWDDEQADEFDSYGPAFQEAFLALHDGENKKAVELFETLVKDNPDAVFLHLERGLALHASGRPEDGIEAVSRFLTRLEDTAEQDDDEEDDEPRAQDSLLRAHRFLAEMHVALEDLESAEDHLNKLVELQPENSAPYVVLGNFLTSQKRAEEAIEVLKEGEKYMGEMQPDMRVIREVGFAQLMLEKKDEAANAFQACLDYRIGLGDFDYDPTVALPLAGLYEEKNDLDRACNIYRHLAAGSHAAGHFAYNLKAAELLKELGDELTSRKHLTKARELATTAEQNEAIDKLGATDEE